MSEESITENDLLLPERNGRGYSLNSDPDGLYSETLVKIPLENEADTQEGIRFPFEHGPQRLGLELPPGKKYHLFISCSSSDIEEANKICEKFESRFSLKCMQSDRDFVIGKLLHDNINDEMTKSVKVVIFMSPAYIVSPYCMAEAHEAIQLAYSEGKNIKIIPVLLCPTEDVKLPSFLKRYRYIDAQKEDDVPAKILEAYYHSGAVDAFQVQEEGLTAEDIKNQNGARLMSKTFLQQRPYLENGYVYETEPLTFNEREYLQSVHEKCEEQFEAAASLLASQRLLRFYKIFVLPIFVATVGGLLAVLTVSSILILFIATILCTRSQKIFSTSFTFILFSLFAVIVLWCVFVSIILVWRKRMTVAVRRKLWQEVNKKYFRETKCLIVYDDTIVREPCILVIRYNTTECQEYFAILLERKNFQLDNRRNCHLDDDEIQKIAAGIIEKILEKLQSFGLLTQWSQLDAYDYNRHNTWIGKQCLCQMLEKYLLKEKAPVITV